MITIIERLFISIVSNEVKRFLDLPLGDILIDPVRDV